MCRKGQAKKEKEEKGGTEGTPRRTQAADWAVDCGETVGAMRIFHNPAVKRIFHCETYLPVKLEQQWNIPRAIPILMRIKNGISQIIYSIYCFVKYL
jgi:hypothetical protein